MKFLERATLSLQKLKELDGFRSLKSRERGIDFSSNDYLGFAQSEKLRSQTELAYHGVQYNGSGGSRLLSGNHKEMESLEAYLATFYESEAAILFNAGYNANVGLIGSIGGESDCFICDAYIHASLHDGLKFSKAKKVFFQHNSLEDLEKKLKEEESRPGQIFVLVESLYSMDGDFAPLTEMAQLCQTYQAALIVDEAHAGGVLGRQGRACVDALGLNAQVFARVITFGKAFGSHGAVVLCNSLLKSFLINFSRPFIFSTSMSLHNISQIKAALALLIEEGDFHRKILFDRIDLFLTLRLKSHLADRYSANCSPIQTFSCKDNQEALQLSDFLYNAGFDIRPIRFPSVPRGKERLRICIHSFNSGFEIENLFEAIEKYYI